MHHGFELARPADGPGDGVVHGRNLAPDCLPHGGDRLFGQLVGLGEPDGDLGHGRSHEAQFLGPPYEKGEEPEDDDGNQNGGSRRQGRGAEESSTRKLVGNDAVSKEAANDEPGDGGASRHEKWRARGPLLEGKDQAADGRNIVIGGGRETALRRRAGGPAGLGQVTRGRGASRGLGQFDRLGLFLALEIPRLLLFALEIAWLLIFALALLGLEPVGQGGPSRRLGATLRLRGRF